MRFIAGVTLDSHLYEVWLDGVRQPLAVRADDTPGFGFVTSYKIDAAGEICRNDADRAQFVTLRGDVEIRLAN